MIVFDIDDTISPTRPQERSPVSGETKRAWGFNILIPDHILAVLRARDDIALLSTWGKAARHVPEAFDFKAEIIDMEEYTEELGIKGKFEVIKLLKPAGWADDHITPTMKKWAQANGVATVKPSSGYITEKDLAKFITAIEASA